MMYRPAAQFLFVLFSLSAAQGWAEEPARDFLNGLRARGLHDIAIEYLDSMATSPLAPAELKATIPYEKAVTLIAASRKQSDQAQRKNFLAQAETLLKQFTTQKPQSSKANAARSQLGKLIVERARIKAEQAKNENSKPLFNQSRTLYEEAFKVFGEFRATVEKQLNEIPKVLDLKDRKQAALAQQRTQLRADNLQTELLAAAIREESADTVPEGSKEHEELLIEAAALYEQIYKNYRTRLAGLYARMYQGRCNQRLGRLREALGYYGELLDQPDSPEQFYLLKTKTLRRAMECWLSPSQRKYAEAIKRAGLWIDVTPKNKDRELDAIAIHLSLARAFKMQADDNADDKRTYRLSIENAQREAIFVAKQQSEFQEEAQKLIEELGGSSIAVGISEPQTFDAAMSKGKESLDAIAPASKTVRAIASKLRNEKDDSKRRQLQIEHASAEEALATAETDAMKYFRLALEFSDRDTPQSEINLVRYFLCYLYYQRQEYFEAALLGDFVAQRYPDTSAAKQCGQIALACYVQLYRESEEDTPEFEISQVVVSASHIADTWPDTQEATDALTTLVPFMISSGDLKAAEKFTLRIPESSAERLKAELSTGQAMWGKVLSDSAELQQRQQNGSPSDASLEAKQIEIKELTQSAKRMLAAGISHLPEDPVVDVPIVTAALSLAQAHLESMEYEASRTALMHPTVGALTLVRSQHEAIADAKMVEETYRTALRATAGALSSGDEKLIDEAKELMTAMQTAVGSDAAGIQRMLSVYVSLAQDIQRQMRAVDSEMEKEKLSQVFESFMTQLSSGSSNLAVLNWVAETFSKMAEGFEIDGKVTPNAKKYYEKSIASYGAILERTKVDPQTAMAVELRQAASQQKIGEFESAIAVYLKILKQNPMTLNIQVQAARTLQAWGATDSSRYREAIYGHGGQPSKHVIWGWAKIANTAVNYEQFRITFFEARYGIAECKYLTAQDSKDEEKQKLLRDVAKVLRETQQLYPNLDDGAWKQQFETLEAKL